ncbi:endonuclease VII domain-containing protein [Spongiactinospora rosea]
MRTCSRCKNEKPLTEFHAGEKKIRKDGSQYVRPRTVCKACVNARRRELALDPTRRQANASYYHRAKAEDPDRWDFLWGKTAKIRKYGLTPDDLERLRRELGNRCPICMREASLVMDHDHKTGRLRGLICGTCNTGLGLLGDNIGRLFRAIGYLHDYIGPEVPPKQRRTRRKLPPISAIKDAYQESADESL